MIHKIILNGTSCWLWGRIFILDFAYSSRIFPCFRNSPTGSDLRKSLSFPMFFRCLLVFGHFLVHRIYLSVFYVNTSFRVFGDQSMLRTVDFRLEERIIEKKSAAAFTPPDRLTVTPFPWTHELPLIFPSA